MAACHAGSTDDPGAPLRVRDGFRDGTPKEVCGRRGGIARCPVGRFSCLEHARVLHRRAAITGGMVAGRVTGASPPFNLTPIDLNRSFIAGTAQADHLTAGAESTQPAG